MADIVIIDRAAAETIDNVFLPANPRKIRAAHPDTIKAVEDFKRALAPAGVSAAADPVRDAAPELLEVLKFAVARVRLANVEGDPILSAWLPDAHAIIAKAEGLADGLTPSLTGGKGTALDALRRAERFMSGFEDDPLQDGIDCDLEAIRSAIASLEDGRAARASSSEHSGRDQQ